MNFSHTDHKCRGKGEDIDDWNMDGSENFNLSCSILSTAARILSNY